MVVVFLAFKGKEQPLYIGYSVAAPKMFFIQRFQPTVYCSTIVLAYVEDNIKYGLNTRAHQL